MYCRYCGAKLADDMTFCPKCGNKIWHPEEQSGADNSNPDWIQLVCRFTETTGEQKSAAFEQLYMAAYKPVFAYVQRYTQNRQASEDAVQSAFVICYEKIGQLENASNFLPWMKQVAYNEFLKTVRKYSKEVAITPISDEEGNETDSIDLKEDDTMLLPEDAYADNELQKLLLQSINELSESQRIIIKGFYFDNKPITKLAEELDMPVNTVKTNLSRGRKNLEKKAQSYANAYGLKLVPLAFIPFAAILAKKDVFAAELTATSQVGQTVWNNISRRLDMDVMNKGNSIAQGADNADPNPTDGISIHSNTSGTDSAASKESATSPVHSAGHSVAVKAVVGITVAAVAAGSIGVYSYHRNKDNTTATYVVDSGAAETGFFNRETSETDTTETGTTNREGIAAGIAGILAPEKNNIEASNKAIINYVTEAEFDPVNYLQAYCFYLYGTPKSSTAEIGFYNSSEQIISQFSFDSDNNITRIESQPTGYGFIYTYDKNGHLLSRTSDQGVTDSITWEYGTDSVTAGHMDSETFGGTEYILFSYNDDGRVAGLCEKDNTIDPVDFTYTDGILTEADFNLEGAIFAHYTFQVNNNGQIISYNYYEIGEETPEAIYFISYNEDGTLSEISGEGSTLTNSSILSYDIKYIY